MLKYGKLVSIIINGIWKNCFSLVLLQRDYLMYRTCASIFYTLLVIDLYRLLILV